MSVDGRVVAATWIMTRLVDPLFVDRSLRGYRLVAGLALGGIALALALTVGLARTVRRQAAERERLQTELRRSERLAALGKLLAGVAHEVRNPLAGIRSTAQLWQRGSRARRRSRFDDLIHEVDRLEEIVSRLLQFSRADAQDLAPGDLNVVAAEAARLAEGRAASREIRVELDLEPDLPPIEMAPPALVQVLRNLTTNALQVMPRGGMLRLATRRDAARGTRSRRALPTTGRASPPRSCRTCSNHSSPPRPRGPGWAWRSLARSRWPTGASSVPRTAPADRRRLHPDAPRRRGRCPETENHDEHQPDHRRDDPGRRRRPDDSPQPRPVL